jgi:hypothetical protein
MPWNPPLHPSHCLLCLLILSISCLGHAAPAAVAVASSGDIVAIDSSGGIALLTPSKFAPGPSCAYDASAETFFSLQRAASSDHRLSPLPATAAQARLIGINKSSGATVVDNRMPFDVSNATAFEGQGCCKSFACFWFFSACDFLILSNRALLNFAAGLDFYLALNSNASDGAAALVAVGGDQLEFVHVLSVKVSRVYSANDA